MNNNHPTDQNHHQESKKDKELVNKLDFDLFGLKKNEQEGNEKNHNNNGRLIPEEFASCTKIWEHFSRCMSTSYQLDQIYRYGTSKPCNDRFNDFRKCLYVKILKDPQEIMKIYKTTEYYESKTTTKNDIFQYKEKPDWE